MRDEIDARLWADNHKQISDGVGRLIETVRTVSDRLVAYLYDAPWDRGPVKTPRG